MHEVSYTLSGHVTGFRAQPIDAAKFREAEGACEVEMRASVTSGIQHSRAKGHPYHNTGLEHGCPLPKGMAPTVVGIAGMQHRRFQHL